MIYASLISSVVVLIMSSFAMAAFTTEEAAELLVEAKATATKFKAETKGADAVFAGAKGVVVCPDIKNLSLL